MDNIVIRKIGEKTFKVNTDNYIKMNKVDDGTFNIGNGKDILITLDPKIERLSVYANNTHVVLKTINEIENAWESVYGDQLISIYLLEDEAYIIHSKAIKQGELNHDKNS